jgi:hypothetical protein
LDKKKPVRDGLFLMLFESLVARAALAGLRFVDLQGATLTVGAVQGFDSLAGAFVIHFDEAETAGTTGVAILNDMGGSDLTILGKQSVQIGSGSGPGQITNIDVLRQKNNSREKKGIKNALILMKTAIIRNAKTVFNSCGI